MGIVILLLVVALIVRSLHKHKTNVKTLSYEKTKNLQKIREQSSNSATKFLNVAFR
jgi:hypothetical protein